MTSVTCTAADRNSDISVIESFNSEKIRYPFYFVVLTAISAPIVRSELAY